MFAGKITAGSTDYYVPIYPCVTRMADVPAITLPVTNSASSYTVILSTPGYGQELRLLGNRDPGRRPEPARAVGVVVRAGDRRAGVRNRDLSRSADAREGRHPGQPVHVRHSCGGCRSPAVVHAERLAGERAAHCVSHDLPECRRQLQCSAGHERCAGRDGDVSFSSCTSGQLSYTFTDGSGRTGTIPLSRITQNLTCSATGAHTVNPDFAFSGNWYSATTSGQGFTVEVNPGNRSVFVPWYTYAPAGSGAGAAGQRWYTASGDFTPGSRSIALQLYETTGGAFDATAPATKSVPVGTATLAFQSCSTATFTFNFTGGSSSGASGTIGLTRVGPVPAGCL